MYRSHFQEFNIIKKTMYIFVHITSGTAHLHSEESAVYGLLLCTQVGDNLLPENWCGLTRDQVIK